MAFVLAFYALIARERRTPYITTNTVYWTAVLVLGAVVFGGLGVSIERLLPRTGAAIGVAANVLLLIALLHVIWRILALKNSHIAFRTDNLIKNLSPIRRFRSYRRSVTVKPSYEHNAKELSEKLLESLSTSPHLPAEGFKDSLSRARAQSEGHVLSLSAAYTVSSRDEATSVLVDLAKRFLLNGCFVQYTTCARHPIEMIRALKAAWNELPGKDIDWKTAAQKIVVVDGYTPHFGFTDTIHEEAKKKVVSEGVHYVDSPPSFAGIHTANAHAFNVLKANQQVRETGLIIYEGSHALVDLESAEQFRIFVRHVAPSERLWGGMFSVFVEFGAPDDVKRLLRAHVDVYRDLSADVD